MSSIERDRNPAQIGFVWTADQGGTTIVIFPLEESRQVSDPARERLTRNTGVRAIGGVPMGLESKGLKEFIDRQRGNMQS